jgi:hypothetical protein
VVSVCELLEGWRKRGGLPLEAEYPNVAFSPRLPTPRPAIDAVTNTREGSSTVAFFWRRGANLRGY